MPKNTDDLKGLKRVVQATLVDGSEPLTQEKIRETIELYRAAHRDVTNDEAEALAQELEQIHNFKMSHGVTLHERDFKPWLAQARSQIDPYYWDRYRQYLGDSGLARDVLSAIDRDTEQILDALENPQKLGQWDRRGMVVGQVQSGKTANYIGLACKAADAGYKVIIIIAGIHRILRNQTQIRVDEGLIGFDSSILDRGRPEAIVGVGRYDITRQPFALTDSIHDFHLDTARRVNLPFENSKEPAVFVIKKNVTTLRNLINWIRLHNLPQNNKTISHPIILIDDEADHASINVARNPDLDVSRINGQIRELLSLFDRSCYVGYTATPFANIFIDPDTSHDVGEDLFPKHFIHPLNPPSNYVGPDQIFGSESDTDESETSVRYIEDNDDLLPVSHKITHRIEKLPESLCKAIRTFILARAIRIHRRQDTEHNSMLVNISRFTSIHAQVRGLVNEQVDKIRRHVRINGLDEEAINRGDPEIMALYQVFLEEYGNLSDVQWSDIQPLLHDSVGPVQVVEVNSNSSQPLSYAENQENGFNVIAVGGNSLSRGLTLEGLTVSYLLRNSVMYDTIMQMARWFGYRPGYADLCRVWMSEEAKAWYSHITESINELREDLRYMTASGATPQEFGLRVRSHPNTLIVTAMNKMRSGKKYTLSVGLADSLIETVSLLKDKETIEINRNAVASLVETIFGMGHDPEKTEPCPHGKLFRNIPVDAILEFVTAFSNDPASGRTDREMVYHYIQNHRTGFLKEWDVLFASRQEPADGELTDSSLGFNIHCQRRTPVPPKNSAQNNNSIWVSSRQRLASRGVESAGLTLDEIEAAKQDYRDNNLGSSQNFPDNIFRRVKGKPPLLIIHLLALGKKGEDLSSAKSIVAYSMSFPKSDGDEKKVEYVVNTTWFRDRYQPEDEDGEDDDY